MRITDLLDVRSISLNAAPADKSQTLDAGGCSYGEERQDQ